MSEVKCTKEKLINDYIKKIDMAIDNYNSAIEPDEEIVNLLIEIVNVFENDIPNLQGSLLIRIGTEIRDANTTRAILIKYLADSGIEYKGKGIEENVNEKRFWNSFIHWFETELPGLELLDGKYLRWDNWDGGIWLLDLDYDHEFTLYRGTVYSDSLKNNTGDFNDIKAFIEIAYKYWIINSGECHYKFTIEVNDRFKIFKLPYRLQSGIVIKQGYKTTFPSPLVLRIMKDKLKTKVLKIIFAGSSYSEKYNIIEVLKQNQYSYPSEEVHNIYETIQASATSKFGKKIISDNSNLANLIAKYVKGYNVIFELPTKWDRTSQKSIADPNFLPLLKNQDGEVVSYIGYSENSGYELLLPFCEKKDELIERLVTSVLPEILPDFFLNQKSLNG